MGEKKLHLVSLGCTKNLVDSEVMLGRLSHYNITDDPSSADVIIVNTCGFIEAAKSESLETIMELHGIRKKGSLLVISGCLSERYKKELQGELHEVDIFTGVGDYDKIDTLIEQRKSLYSPEVFLADENISRVITGSNYHAYIKIAEGCNQSCSFCAIPNFKGKLHSRSIDSIIKEVTSLVARGYWDFSFISQDSSSYGRDIGLKNGLIELINAIEQIKGVKSAKILYLYPSTTTFALIDAIADSSVFQTYYDIPIQHSDEEMLKIMKRGFGEIKTKELLKHMRSKENAFIRSTFIVGHPGESDEAFEGLCEYVRNFGFDRFNVFEYSNEEDTAAFNMEQVDPKIITQRAKTLGDIAIKSTQASMVQLVGKEIEAVIDGESSEHEYLLSARALNWEREIDGEILVNDTSDISIDFGKRYTLHITELIGDDTMLATVKKGIQ
ncbi:MAG: 30S ribosomal protein S12 methylthiotransferase RimO [Campylobacterales bacterium]|nr:30S ribosomal protein S12 methylthiotransferase RimO [Campylobacterales bacterium]